MLPMHGQLIVSANAVIAQIICLSPLHTVVLAIARISQTAVLPDPSHELEGQTTPWGTLT